MLSMYWWQYLIIYWKESKYEKNNWIYFWGKKRENVSIEIIRSCQDIPSGTKHFIANPIKTMIISYEDVEENAKISKAVHKILKNKKKGK